MAIQKKPISLGLNIPSYENDLQRIAAERMFTDGLIGPNVGAVPQPQVEMPQAPALPAMTPYTIPNINLPQFNAPEAPVYTPYSETEQGRQLIDELSKRRMEAEERQREQMNQAQVQLQDYLSKQQALDLLPVAALVDTWTGSNMARYFKDEKDVNRELALELQKELLKYGQQGITSEAEYLKDRLGAGTDEAKIGAQLAQAKYEADLRARQSLYDTNIDTAAKLKIAEEARKAAEALEKFKQSEAFKRAQLRAGRQGAAEARQEKKDRQQAMFKLESVPEYRLAPKRENLLNVLNAYENALRSVDDITSIPGPKATMLSNAYNAYKIAQKEADNLGALTGPDVGIITGQVPDATSVAVNLTDAARKGLATLGLAQKSSAKQEILDSIERARQKILESHETSINYLRNTLPDEEFVEPINRVDSAFKSKLRPSRSSSQPKIGAQPPEVMESKPKTLEEKKAYLEQLKRQRGVK